MEGAQGISEVVCSPSFPHLLDQCLLFHCAVTDILVKGGMGWWPVKLWDGDIPRWRFWLHREDVHTTDLPPMLAHLVVLV